MKINGGGLRSLSCHIQDGKFTGTKQNMQKEYLDDMQLRLFHSSFSLQKREGCFIQYWFFFFSAIILIQKICTVSVSACHDSFSAAVCMYVCVYIYIYLYIHSLHQTLSFF